MTVKLPMLRLQVRCPALPGNASRSGPLILDIHDATISSGESPKAVGARFADDAVPPRDNLATVRLRRLLIATAGPADTKATGILSLGPLQTQDPTDAGPPLHPLISIHTPTKAKTCVDISVPSLYVNITKPTLDALQYAIDDASQLIEVTFGSDHTPGIIANSNDASIIGSRFFAKSRSGSDITVGPAPPLASQDDPIVKVSIDEGNI